MDIKDFDGDALNFTLCIDNYLHNKLLNNTFDSSVLNLAAPFEISKDLAYPKPVISTISNWLNTQENDPDPAKLEMMNNLFGNSLQISQ